MLKNQHGGVDIFAILLGFSCLLLVGTSAFGIWAFMERQDYKDNSDQKALAAAEVAVADREVTLEAEFAERSKSPYDSYTSPSAFGSVKVTYPRTWSAYIKEPQTGQTPVEAVFSDKYVVSGSGNTYELRMNVTEQALSQELSRYDSAVRSGKVSVTAFNPALLPEVSGYRIEGEITSGIQGALVLLPLRDKTVKVWTERTENINDFNNIVLPQLTFNP